MKIPALVGNEKGVSVWSTVEIPIIGEKNRSVTAKQDADYWGLAINQPNEDHPVGTITTSPTDIHPARIIAVMSGRTELTVGTGETRRFGTGEIFFVYGRGGHIATAMKPWPRTTLSITMPGTGVFK